MVNLERSSSWWDDGFDLVLFLVYETWSNHLELSWTGLCFICSIGQKENATTESEFKNKCYGDTIAFAWQQPCCMTLPWTPLDFPLGSFSFKKKILHLNMNLLTYFYGADARTS